MDVFSLWIQFPYFGNCFLIIYESRHWSPSETMLSKYWLSEYYYRLGTVITQNSKNMLLKTVSKATYLFWSLLSTGQRATASSI